MVKRMDFLTLNPFIATRNAVRTSLTEYFLYFLKKFGENKRRQTKWSTTNVMTNHLHDASMASKIF